MRQAFYSPRPPKEEYDIMADFIRDNINKDGIDRRGFLRSAVALGPAPGCSIIPFTAAF